jgi:hypothetical protein
MASIDFHSSHLPDEERPKAEAELRWLEQESRRKGSILPRVVMILVVAAAFAAGILWDRGEHLIVGVGLGVLAIALLATWLAIGRRRRRRFAAEWELTVLRWHAARAQIKEAIRTHDPKEAAAQAHEESRLRSVILELLRAR